MFTKLNNNNVFTNNISMQHFLHFYHKLLEHKVQFSVITDPQNTLACFVTSSCVHTTVNLDDLCVTCAGAFHTRLHSRSRSCCFCTWQFVFTLRLVVFRHKSKVFIDLQRKQTLHVATPLTPVLVSTVLQ